MSVFFVFTITIWVLFYNLLYPQKKGLHFVQSF